MNWNRRIWAWAWLALAAGIAVALPAAESDAQKRGLPGTFGRPPSKSAQNRLVPLPVATPAAKPAVFRGFYIGMPLDEALAAAASAVAPWPAFMKVREHPSEGVSIFLRDGPKDAWTINSCIRKGLPPSTRLTEQQCISNYEGEHFRFDMDLKTNLVKRFRISPSYVLREHGYNVGAAGLNPEDFANLLGKRLGISFKKITPEKKECVRALDALWRSYCLEDTGPKEWWTANDPKICKCKITIYDNYAILAEHRNEDAVQF